MIFDTFSVLIQYLSVLDAQHFMLTCRSFYVFREHLTWHTIAELKHIYHNFISCFKNIEADQLIRIYHHLTHLTLNDRNLTYVPWNLHALHIQASTTGTDIPQIIHSAYNMPCLRRLKIRPVAYCSNLIEILNLPSHLTYFSCSGAYVVNVPSQLEKLRCVWQNNNFSECQKLTSLTLFNRRHDVFDVILPSCVKRLSQRGYVLNFAKPLKHVEIFKARCLNAHQLKDALNNIVELIIKNNNRFFSVINLSYVGPNLRILHVHQNSQIPFLVLKNSSLQTLYIHICEYDLFLPNTLKFLHIDYWFGGNIYARHDTCICIKSKIAYNHDKIFRH